MSYRFKVSLFCGVIAAAVSLILYSAFAHSGRTDSSGGHYNRKTGGYHYHGKKSNKAPSKSTKPFLPPRPRPSVPKMTDLKKTDKADKGAQSDTKPSGETIYNKNGIGILSFGYDMIMAYCNDKNCNWKHYLEPTPPPVPPLPPEKLIADHLHENPDHKISVKWSYTYFYGLDPKRRQALKKQFELKKLREQQAAIKAKIELLEKEQTEKSENLEEPN